MPLIPIDVTELNRLHAIEDTVRQLFTLARSQCAFVGIGHCEGRDVSSQESSEVKHLRTLTAMEVR